MKRPGAVLRLFHGAYSQPEHAAGLLQGGAGWCEARVLFDLAQVKPAHVAAYIECWACRGRKGRMRSPFGTLALPPSLPSATAAQILGLGYNRQKPSVTQHTNGIASNGSAIVKEAPMRRALIRAVEHAHAAEQHAAGLGFSLHWSSDDVSRIAISLFIQRGGGR